MEKLIRSDFPLLFFLLPRRKICRKNTKKKSGIQRKQKSKSKIKSRFPFRGKDPHPFRTGKRERKTEMKKEKMQEAPMTADEIIQTLNMFPLEMEGGYCCELYQSGRRLPGGRPCGSGIYYLLKSRDRSRWHKLDADELWYYHCGSPILQLLIYPDGSLKRIVIGPDILHGETPQSIVPAHTWQTSITLRRGTEDWSLVGTAVFPGFEYSAFTGADDSEILASYPQWNVEIRSFLSLVSAGASI